ncbi:MAG: RdgB/HAM1 family non-canonical purine NTP pyrophosphatase [Candidatus Cloacimonetes bacterium]|nr:RdgB/HAM1 family non-canonical purine NTP pyrophosphatase [Candidatus Cloacimonadota bacterium]
MILLLASRNPDKITELRDILQDVDCELHSALDIDLPKVIEDKDTIIENAIKKAVECASYTGFLTLADDTGLFVASLDGLPGVKAARYAGAHCTYSDNRKKLLQALQNRKNREAEFRTAVALADSSGLIGTSTGSVKGEITESEQGFNGFGYDPIFRVHATGKTFAEMTLTEKQQFSHRGQALLKILPVLRKYIIQKQE